MIFIIIISTIFTKLIQYQIIKNSIDELYLKRHNKIIDKTNHN